MAMRYRVEVFGRPRGPWREKAEHARQDAIAEGLASWDAERREWFLAVPVDIAVQHIASPPAPRLNGARALPLRHREPWTDQDVGDLRRMVAEGHIVPEIAHELARTQEAVARKAIRLGVRHEGRRRAKV